MKCPICQRPVKLADPESPFCGARCREVDLGNWAMEKYVISEPLASSSALRGTDPDGGFDED